MNVNFIRTTCKFLLIASGHFICCFSMAAQNNKAENKSENKKYKMHEELGLKIFQALQKKDTLAWIELYPTQQEYAHLLKLMLDAKTDGLTQKMVDQMLVQREKESVSAFTKEFAHFLQQSESLNIDWSKCMFRKFDFIAAPAEKINMRYLTGEIGFSCGKAQFVIEGIEALEVSGAYKLQAVKEIRNIEDSERP
jgi:hypothetical protein